MKASRLISAVIVTATFTFTGCQRLEEFFNRDEVRFSSRTSGCGLALTRAEYSGSTYTEGGKTFYNIVWEVGDGISIASPQASEETRLDYTVATVTSDGNVSKATLTKESAKGLRWGSDGEYKFYAVTPANETFNIFGTVNFKFPSSQTQGDGSGWVGDTYVVKPNPAYMFMSAMATVNKTTSITNPLVDLDFKFFPTVMDFTLSGESDMTIKKIGIESSSLFLSGVVNLDLNQSDEYGYPYGLITATDKTNAVSILTVGEDNKPIFIEKGKKIRVCLFVPTYHDAIANKVQDVTDLKFSVTFVDGGEEETLTTDLKKRENESSEYKFLSFKPHLRHIIKGLVLPEGISWDMEGEVSVVPWDETTEHEPEFEEKISYPGSDEDPIQIGDVIWAPVNCGTDADHPYGLLYQWGRKDGQGYKHTTYSPNETNPTIATVFQGTNGVYTGTYPLSATTFYKFGDDLTFRFDWITSGSNTYWNKATSPNDATQEGKITPIKGDFDPCPEGWRVPTFYELNALLGNHTSGSLQRGNHGTLTNVYGKYFDGSTSSTPTSGVFLPAAGFRDDFDGVASYRGTDGYYWSSSVHRNNGRFLKYSGMNGTGRASGCSVRCVYDK